MKFLNDKDYNAMKAKADHFDMIVAAVLANGVNIKPEDVTAQTIIESMQNDSDDDESDLQTQLDTSNSRVTELETELEAANDRIAELENDDVPGEKPASITSKGEPGGEELDIAKFADKNKGNTAAILEQAVKEGLI